MNEVTQQNAESARELASTMAVFKDKEGGGGNFAFPRGKGAC